MTAQQLVTSCEKRGIVLFVRENGRVGYKGPKEVVTPKLLGVLGQYHDAIKQALVEEMADLAEQGALVDAHIAKCEFDALVDAVRAARANRMPSADKLDSNYAEGFEGVLLRPGHLVWEPNKWFCDALNRVYTLIEKYGPTWRDDDPRRPYGDQHVQILVDDIETVVWWWYEWQRRNATTKTVENCGSRMGA